MIRKKIAAAAAAWLCTFPSYATNALALEIGRGEDRNSNATESTADVGLHLVQANISAARVFSTAVQFGDHVGIGWRSGHWDFAARLQHLSKCRTGSPESGNQFRAGSGSVRAALSARQSVLFG